MLMPLLALVAGILAAHYGAPMWAAIILIGIGIAVYSFFLLKFKSPLAGYRYGKINYIWPIFLIFGIGILSYDYNRPFIIANDDFSNYKSGRCHIIDINNKTGGDRVTILVNSLYGADGKEYICDNFKAYLYTAATECCVDDEILIPANFRVIESPLYSVDDDVVNRLHNKGIYYSVDVKSNDIHKIGHHNTPKGIAINIRDRLASCIENTGFSQPVTHFLITILLGDKAYIDENQRSLFADAGISHTLALSGLHVGIIAGIFMFLLFPINFAGLYKWRIAISTLLVWIYAVISGMSPSIVRSCIMATALLISLILERKGSAFNGLCLATFIILLVAPFDLFDIGLQLSFACVAGLIFFAGRLNFVEHKQHPILFNTVALLIATIISTFVSWIIAAYYFHIVPTTFLPANLLVLPLLPGFLVASIIIVLLSQAGLNVHLGIDIINRIYALFIRFLETLSSDSAGVLHYRPSAISVFLWLTFLIIAAIWFEKYGQFRFSNATMSNRKNPGLRRNLLFSMLTLFCLAVISMPLTAQMPKHGVVIHNVKKEIRISILSPDTVTTICADRGRITSHSTNFCNILVIDNQMASDAIFADSSQYDIIVIGQHGKPVIKNLCLKYPDAQYIIHPSIKAAAEQELTQRLQLNHISSSRIHSLHRSGHYKQIY